MISGFFLITSTSTVELNNSIVSNTKGQIASAFYVQIGCALSVQNSILTQIGDAEAVAKAPVILAENARLVHISQTEFDSNINTYVHGLSAQIDIVASEFKNGSGDSFIVMENGALSISGSDIKKSRFNETLFSGNANEEDGEGLGIKCSQCSLSIDQAKFTDLQALTGAALKIDSSSEDVSIKNTAFLNLKTKSYGGALDIIDTKVDL